MSRTIIIGDVHGCLRELQELIARLAPTPKDTLVFVGDLIHKGPHSARTVQWVQNLGVFSSTGKLFKNSRVVVLMGNHEERHIRWHGHEYWVSMGTPNPMLHTEGYAEMGINDSQIEWLKTTKLYHQGDGFLVVHGGVPMKMQKLPPSTVEGARGLPKRERTQALSMLRLRYQTSGGKQVAMGKERPQDHYWAETYDGRFGHVYFGHQAFDPAQFPRRYPHATPLDYGCVHGGMLVAAVIDNHTKEVTLESVNAHETYQSMLHLMAREP